MTIAKTNVIAKVAAVVAGLGLVLSSFAYAAPASAATEAELLAAIAKLQAEIAAMSGSSTGAAFTMDMTIGASGAEVTRLQQWLISKGYAIPAGATGYFGAQTAAAVAAFQTANAITPAAGYFGPITRAKVNAMLGGSTGGSTGGNTGGSTGGDLEGGAGSIDSFDEMGYSSEQVGEDEEDVEIAGLEVEADDGSDLEITAVRLDFATQPGNDDLDEFVTEVSIWLDGEEYARIDADEFNDDNEWTKTVSLDDGAIIRAGETGELVVAVSGVSNIDSDDAGDDWGLDFVSVRFVDADGATITENTTTDEFTWDVNTFATANDVSLEVSLTDSDDADDINDAHVIDVESGATNTEDIEVLAFTLEAEGSDITVDDIPAVITTTGETDESVIVIRAMLLDEDGEELDSVDVPAGGAITFTDLDLEVGDGETVDLVIAVDLEDLTGALDDGDTIQASVTSTNVDAIDAEDASGEEIADGDADGSAVGDASAVYDVGFQLEFNSASELKTVEAEAAAGADQGQFVIKYDVTAFDGDIYIDNTCVEDNDGSEVATATSYSVTNNASNSTTCVVTSSGTTDSGTAFLIEEGETETITLTVNVTATADAFAQVSLEAIGWDDAAGGDDNVYDFDLPGDFKTDPLYLNFVS